MNDLVVVVPGIGGSALHRGNQPLWDPTLGGLISALKSWGRSLTSLTLPVGLGDATPDDGVHAPHLVEDVHVIPGIWTPIRGYTQLLRKLRDLGFTEQTGNLLPLPYDWRTSVRSIVAVQTPLIDRALERWRSSNPANADARIVFIAHSMGGLVSRSYATTHRDEVRKIITLGTPSRGSIVALKVLTQGLGPNWGWLRDATRRFAGSLPGLHQLLPSFPCIDTDGNYENFAFLDAANPVNGLDARMAAAGVGFLTDLATIESADPGFHDRVHPLIGWQQDTLSSLRLRNGEPEFLTGYGRWELSGDGTVPHAGAVPKGMSLDSTSLHGFPEQHGNLQANPAVLTEITRILTNAPPVTLRGDEIGMGASVPELLQQGDDLVVEVSLPPVTREAVAVVLGSGNSAVERRPAMVDGRGAAVFPSMPPGVHTVTVRGVRPGSPLLPVTGTVTVWGSDWSPS